VVPLALNLQCAASGRWSTLGALAPVEPLSNDTFSQQNQVTSPHNTTIHQHQTCSAGIWQQRHVAIKTVLFQSSEQDNKMEVLAREAAIACGLSHRNLVTTFSHDLAEICTGRVAPLRSKKLSKAKLNKGTVFMFFLVQEYCNSGSLRQAIERRRFQVGGMSQRWAPIVSTLQGIARGMDHMHSMSIVHSNLNPSNILLTVRVCLLCLLLCTC
jgi:serine/threonine protein kinase